MNFSITLITLIVFIPSTFFCCAQKNQVDSTLLFDKDNFFRDTLFIKTRFMECGEWGGHLESSKIYLKGNHFYLNYQKYSADCETIKENNGELSQTLIKTITKKLTNEDILLIKKYAHELVDAKFREPTMMHAGYIFELKTSNEDLNIYVYTWGKKTIEYYVTFIAHLLE